MAARIEEVMTKPAPLKIVKQTFGSKGELVQKILGALGPNQGETPEATTQRLARVSNAKLLHLLSVAEKAKKLGGRESIVQAIAKHKGHAQDGDYVKKLSTYSLARLVDTLQSLKRRTAAKL